MTNDYERNIFFMKTSNYLQTKTKYQMNNIILAW